MLKQIEEEYPTCSIIAEVKEVRSEVETRIGERMEVEAKDLSRLAQAAYEKGDHEEALKYYLKIEREYASTTYFQANKALLAGCKKRSEEAIAEQLIARIRKLSPEKDSEQVLRLIETLKSGYSQTDAFAGNASDLARMGDLCMAYGFGRVALEELEAENYRNALAYLEKAVAKNADFKNYLKETFEVVCLKVGDADYEEENYRSAVQCYELYLQLPPEEDKLPADRLASAYHQLGRIQYESEDFEGAEDSLLKARRQLQEDAEFNYLLGNVLLQREKYEEATIYLTKSIDLGKDSPDARKWRGLCFLAVALPLEAEIDAEIGAMEQTMAFLTEAKAFCEEVDKCLKEVEKLHEEAKRDYLKNPLEARNAKRKFLAALVKQKSALRETFMEGKEKKGAITETVGEVQERLKAGVADLQIASQAATDDPDLELIYEEAQKKEKLLAQARKVLEPVVAKELALRRKGFGLVEKKLERYMKDVFWSQKQESRLIEALLSSGQTIGLVFAMSEGQQFLQDALKIEIALEEYLSPPAGDEEEPEPVID